MYRAILVSAFLGLPFALQAATDPDLLALVPANATTVSSIDLTRARSSAFGQYLLNRMDSQDENFRKFVSETGFDPRHDLQNVVFAGTDGDQKKPDRFLLLGRGNFDEERIKATAKSKGAKLRSSNGVDLLVQGTGQDQTAIAFPDPGIAMLGDVATVQEAMANRTTPSLLELGLKREIERISVGNDAWFASARDTAFWKHLQGAPSAANTQALQSISQAAGGVRFGELLKVSLQAETRSPQDATSLADVVRFFSSMLQMAREKDPRAAILASALDNMDLKTSGNEVHLALSVSEKDMEKLMAPGAAENMSFNLGRMKAQ